MQSAVKDVGLCCDKVSTYLVVVFSALLYPCISIATVTVPPSSPPFLDGIGFVPGPTLP